MIAPSSGLTTTGVMAAATEVLCGAGYRRISEHFPRWDTTTSRLFEDDYGIVGLVVFDTLADLITSWPDLQGSLVDIISAQVGREEAKAWDGYLVLLTTSPSASDDAEIEEIRYNTTRLRKLVATGDDLRGQGDVERALSSLLPLGPASTSVGTGSVLELLPELLSKQGIPIATTRVLVEAFRAQAPLMERLHETGTTT